MRRETRYALILGAAALVAVGVQLLAPKPVDWTPTYGPSDKNPFGAYVVNQLMTALFPGQPVSTTQLTVYELRDSLKPGVNLISLSNQFAPDRESVKVLLAKIDSGAHVFIGAFFFSNLFADTLGLKSRDIVTRRLTNAASLNDTVALQFVQPGWDVNPYFYKMENVSNFFDDTDAIPHPVQVLARNSWKEPVTLKISIGKGKLVVSTVPLAFTNAYALTGANHEFIEKTWSHLPVAPVVWTDYYQNGRRGARTPLRYILSEEPLRWAYYLVMGGILLYVLVEAKRRQRHIPIVRPPRNTTLDFVRTIGNMYWQARDYKAIADKKIAFFMDYLRTRYFLAGEAPETFAQALAHKSGNSLQETEELLALIHVIQAAPAVTPQMLTDLNKRIEQFTI